jgi:hypothetical protein
LLPPVFFFFCDTHSSGLWEWKWHSCYVKRHLTLKVSWATPQM